jgi:hypothetical protein
MDLKILLLLPLISVVFVSGCTLPWGNGGTTGESNVIVIQQLTAIPNTIMAGQTTKIVAIVKNQGSESVPYTSATEKITTHLYDFCPGLFILKGGDEAEVTIDSLSINELQQVDWTLEQDPAVQVETSCDTKISVRYPYTTTGLTTIHLIQHDELQRQIAENTYQSKTSEISKGEGPVKVWLEVVGAQPVSVTSGEEGSMSIALHIENTGTGSVVDNNVILKEINLAQNNIEIDPDSTEEGCVMLKTVAGGVDVYISLIQGKKTITCPANIKTEATQFTKESTVFGTVTISYVYEVTKEVKVTVNPSAS